MKKLSLLESHSWFGEFNFLNDKDGLFSGSLNYSPTKGVVLNGLFTRSVIPNQIIHGTIQSIGKVTILVKNFQLEDVKELTGSKVQRAEAKIYCETFIAGEHFTSEQLLFSTCSFRLNNLNRFCNPRNRTLPYADTPLAKANTDSKIDLEIRTEASGTLAFDLISNNLIIGNKQLQKELKESFDNIKSKYPNDYITLKKEQNYYIYLEQKAEKVSLDKFLDELHQIQVLFTFLTIQKTVPIEINLINNKNDSKQYYSVLVNLYVKEDDLQYISEDGISRFHAISLEALPDFHLTYKQWKKFELGHINLLKEALFSKISGQYEPIQLYVLLLAGIEQWVSHKHGSPEQAADKFVLEYSNKHLIDSIKENLPAKKGKENVGKLLMDLRSCIVHSHRSNGSDFPRFQPFMNSISIGNLCEALFGCALIAIFRDLGLNPRSLKNFEGFIDRFIWTYFHGD